MHQTSAHSHSHCRSNQAADQQRLALTLVLILGYLVAEVVGGIMSNSLALLADAGHMLSDAGALALSLFALWIAQRPANPRKTYGYHRAEILAALVNGATLIVIAVFIFIEAFERFRTPPEINSPLMMAVASGGLIVNLIALWILHAGSTHSLNMRGAWLHVLTDALGSVGAIIGGLVIWLYNWPAADAIASIAIALLVIYSSWNLIREAVDVLMEGTPAHLEVAEVRCAMLDARHVAEVHDLHIWTITTGMVALSAHVVIEQGHRHQEVLADLRRLLHDRFNIDHMTIQIEMPGLPEGSSSIHGD